MTGEKRRPPVWLMGLAQLPLGVSGALALITTPQLLAANHVPETQIAGITAIALVAGLVSFLLAPVLDWRFSRRAYAIGLCVATAVLMFAALLLIRHLALLSLLLFAGFMTTMLYVAAIGGWFGALLQPDDKARLGAWFTVGNVGGGGLVASVAIFLLRDLPYEVGAALLGLIAVAPVPLLVWMRAPPADDKLSHEAFGAFFRDVLTVVKRASVRWSLLLFALPGASFALTNTLGGLGADFHASERVVGLVSGVASTVAGVAGSLAVAPIVRRFPARTLYLMIGALGAVFTVGLLLAPRTPVVFAVAILGEVFFQAAAFAVENTIALRTIRENDPLAATQYGLLMAAVTLPLVYMQLIDGQAYGYGGLAGTFMADAGVSLVVCAALGLLLWRFRRSPALAA